MNMSRRLGAELFGTFWLVYPVSAGVWVYRAQGWCGGGREIKTIPRFRKSLGI
jgi:hypothetical protein